MNLTLSQVADLVGGQIRSSDKSITVTGASILRDVQAGEITFVEDDSHLAELDGTRAAAVVIPAGMTLHARPYVQVANVRTAFAQIVAHFRPPRPIERPGVSPAAHISPTASIAEDVHIHAGATIGAQVVIGRGTVVHAGATIMAGCEIGSDVVIYPHAVLYENTRVGDRSIIHAGAVLGAFGFGYESTAEGHRLSSQLGYVAVGADVEIGANSTIDRGTYGATVIGEGTKIDNLVQIGHNCRIGKHNLLCAQVGIAGSCTTGDFVVMAGQVGVRDHVQIGDRAMLGAQSGVSEDLPGHQAYLGAPAIPARQQIQVLLALQKLPELRKQVRQLQREVHGASTLGDERRTEAA